MTTLVVGATGATGRLLVQQLLDREYHVRVIVRSADRLPEDVRTHDRLTVLEASVLDLGGAELKRQVNGCQAVASCLGHNLSFKGIFGAPRRLVTETTRRLCEAVKANRPDRPVRFVLMNTVGNRNRDLDEPMSFAQKCVIGLLRVLVPPHADNEQAADYLRTAIGPSDDCVEWAAVRPDTLIDEPGVTKYEVHLSPIRSAIFSPGRTSRINVAHFMAQLTDDDATWSRWKGHMPVIYNHTSSESGGA
jgi:hypothetical protein